MRPIFIQASVKWTLHFCWTFVNILFLPHLFLVSHKDKLTWWDFRTVTLCPHLICFPLIGMWYLRYGTNAALVPAAWRSMNWPTRIRLFMMMSNIYSFSIGSGTVLFGYLMSQINKKKEEAYWWQQFKQNIFKRKKNDICSFVCYWSI